MAGDNSTDDLENTVVENPHSNDAATTSQDMRSSTTVNRLAVKVPPFWAERPEIWFAQIESQFCIAGIIADKTKFHTVVASMESSVISQITDAVLNPPAVDMYGNLKRNIIERFCESEQKKIQKLLSDIDLGDRRPTQLLNELRGLAKDRINEDFLKSLWMQRLPPHARAILQASNDDLSGMAKLADKILEVEGLAHMNVASVAAPVGSTSLPAHSLHEIVTRLDSLEKRIRSRSRSQSRSSANRDQNSSPAEFDTRRSTLIDNKTSLQAQGAASKICETTVVSHISNNDVARILDDFKQLSVHNHNKQPSPSNVTHVIETTGPAVFARPRRLTGEKLLAAKREFDYMVQRGICRPSKSNWAREFVTANQNHPNETEFIKLLRTRMQSLGQSSTSCHASKETFLQPELSQATHVFVRVDRVRAPLEPPYEGPFQVLDKQSKYFKVRLPTRDVNISIDRLKAAFMDNTQLSPKPIPTQNMTQTTPHDPVPECSSSTLSTPSDPVAATKTSTTTRSGRTVRFPSRYR
ncbi:hypothetical protein ACLKA6_008025 [Drosophila palustris]